MSGNQEKEKTKNNLNTLHSLTDIPFLEFSIPTPVTSLLWSDIDYSKLYIPNISFLNRQLGTLNLIDSLLKDLGPILETVESTMGWLNQVASPEIITEDEFKLRQKRSTEYGSRLWTQNPNVTYRIYELDDKQFEICVKEWEKGDDFADTILAIEDYYTDNLVKEELSEANDCFSHREYRACAGILLSIIDGEICRFVKHMSNEKILTKSSVREKIFKKISEDDLTTMHEWVGIKSAYDRLYCGMDLRRDTIPVCRDSIQHGMNTSKVSKTFCIQLSFFLWNLKSFVHSIKKDRERLILLRLKTIEITQ